MGRGYGFLNEEKHRLCPHRITMILDSQGLRGVGFANRLMQDLRKGTSLQGETWTGTSGVGFTKITTFRNQLFAYIVVTCRRSWIEQDLRGLDSQTNHSGKSIASGLLAQQNHHKWQSFYSYFWHSSLTAIACRVSIA